MKKLYTAANVSRQEWANLTGNLTFENLKKTIELVEVEMALDGLSHQTPWRYFDDKKFKFVYPPDK